MDITLGTIPLIVMTFQGYRIVRNFASEYNTYNKKLRSVLRDITITASIFKDAVNKLLGEVLEEDTRDIMLENLESEHWKQHDLNSQLEGMLGSSFETVRASICRTRETLNEIKRLLVTLSGNTISPSEGKFPFEHLTRNVVVLAAAILGTDPFHFQLKNIQIRSTRKKLLSLARDHRGDLERLRDELREHNREFLAILEIAPYCKSNSRTNKSAGGHQTPRPFQQSGNPPSTITRACLNSRAVQTASRRLYRTVSQPLFCECHSVHLRLDRQTEQKSVVGGVGGGSGQPAEVAEPEPHFSFQLMVKPHDGNKKCISTITQPIRLVFTGFRFPDTQSALQGSSPISAICEESLSRNARYERHFRDNTESSNFGFLLREACCLGVAEVPSYVPLSLDDIVISRPADLRSFDRLLIATNLAYSVVHFYSSPWVADWSLQAIHYFEEQELTPTVGLWTSHLSVNYDDYDLRQFGVKNREIHSLGLILLQLGSKKRLEIPRGEEEDLVLACALQDLCKEMGPTYRDFVKNCLGSWSERSMDLMEEGNLDTFLYHVSVLEKQAQLFGSG